jgi:uncharacterized protein
MIEGTVVIDGVIHGYNHEASNFQENATARIFQHVAYPAVHQSIAPVDDPRYTMSKQQFMRKCTPEFLAAALFDESQTDIAVYHHVPLWGLFRDGGSPLSTGRQLATLAPGRVFSYGAVHAFDTKKAIDELDQEIEEDHIIGLKCYPADLVEGKLVPFRMSDEHVAFPLFEHVRTRGLRVVAIHKALPLGPSPLEYFKLGDLEGALLAFPDLNFELVHAGWAFFEDTAMLAQIFPNLYLNLEAVSGYLNVAPGRFAHVIGSFLQAGAEDRIIWATGCEAAHPRPLLEKFWSFEIPEDLMRQYGYPALTKEIKRKILGANFARLHDFSLEQLAANIPLDERRQRQLHGQFSEPWSGAEVHA